MFQMEVERLMSHSMYTLPVAVVLVLAGLVFLFGFKSVSEPKFTSKTVTEEKKVKKQTKPKDKVTSNNFLFIL